MNRHTGGPIDDSAHIAQSIGDILTTRIGSRLMRREYGSQLVDLIDSPGNPVTLLLAYAAIAASLMRWEPRISLQRVLLTKTNMAGQFELTVEAAQVDTNARLSLRIPLGMGSVT